jgi:hypothetical protein
MLPAKAHVNPEDQGEIRKRALRNTGDRIDASIYHVYEELRQGGVYGAAINNVPKHDANNIRSGKVEQSVEVSGRVVIDVI